MKRTCKTFSRAPHRKQGRSLSPVLVNMVAAVFTATGLVSALFSEGWGDAWAWVGLSVPLAAIAWCCAVRRSA